MNKFPDKKYQIIYADPPWQYDDKSLAGNRGAGCKYDLMSMDDLKDLPVRDIADENCILFIWGTWTHNKEIHELIESWGFVYQTVGFVWIKKNMTGTNFMGMGNMTRANTEYCLIAKKGKIKRIDAGISQIIESIPNGHSKKPDQVRKRIIQLVGDLSRIELFARTKIHGWDTWGNDDKLQAQPLENFYDDEKIINN